MNANDKDLKKLYEVFIHSDEEEGEFGGFTDEDVIQASAAYTRALKRKADLQKSLERYHYQEPSSSAASDAESFVHMSKSCAKVEGNIKKRMDTQPSGTNPKATRECHQSTFKKVGLLDQPLVINGKRPWKPSLKIRMQLSSVHKKTVVPQNKHNRLKKNNVNFASTRTNNYKKCQRSGTITKPTKNKNQSSFKKVGLSNQPLVIKVKRTRKPSMKVQMKLSENHPYNSFNLKKSMNSGSSRNSTTSFKDTLKLSVTKKNKLHKAPLVKKRNLKRKVQTKKENAKEIPILMQDNNVIGPRIKHVSRSASVVLGLPRATFADVTENKTLFNLSALPSTEKEKILRMSTEEKPKDFTKPVKYHKVHPKDLKSFLADDGGCCATQLFPESDVNKKWFYHPIDTKDQQKEENLCMNCLAVIATWVVHGNKRLPASKYYLCRHCFSTFIFDENIIGESRAY